MWRAAGHQLNSGNFMSHRVRYSILSTLCLTAGLMCCGCAGYQVGTATLYRPDIRTVYVPMFQSDSLRRGLGERLTEAVVKEVELKTPYKVVGDPNADSVMNGRILKATKRVIAENSFDEAINLEIGFRVQVSWIDRRGGMIGTTYAMPVAPLLLTVNQTEDLVPEGGQSVATSQQQAIQRMAEQIVSQMEVPW